MNRSFRILRQPRILKDVFDYRYGCDNCFTSSDLAICPACQHFWIYTDKIDYYNELTEF